MCDHFKWNFKDIEELSVQQYNAVWSYMKKLEREQKKAMRKSKK